MSAGSERGFTLIGVLLLCAFMGAGLLAYGELASNAAQRDKERELLFVGNQFRQAIGAYYEHTPGAVKRFPARLADLLEDKRHPVPRRHLRRLYRDPITGAAEWGLVPAPGGGIMGVYSLSQEQPVKTGAFAERDRSFTDAGRYADWQFAYTPLLVESGGNAPGAAE